MKNGKRDCVQDIKEEEICLSLFGFNKLHWQREKDRDGNRWHVYLCEHVTCQRGLFWMWRPLCGVLQQLPSHSKDWEIINERGMSSVFACGADILAWPVAHLSLTHTRTVWQCVWTVSPNALPSPLTLSPDLNPILITTLKPSLNLKQHLEVVSKKCPQIESETFFLSSCRTEREREKCLFFSPNLYYVTIFPLNSSYNKIVRPWTFCGNPNVSQIYAFMQFFFYLLNFPPWNSRFKWKDPTFWAYKASRTWQCERIPDLRRVKNVHTPIAVLRTLAVM